MLRYLVVFGCFIAVTAAACTGSSDSDAAPTAITRSPSETAANPVALNFGIPREAATGSVRVTDGTNTLIIQKILMTLEDIDLERSEQSFDCGELTNVDDHLDCSDYLPGPVLLDLDLTGTAKTLLDIQAPTGTFTVFSFDISVPDGGDPHQVAYINANLDMKDISIRIEGNYNEEPFVFELDLRGDQEIMLDPPLVVTEEGSGFAITVLFDPRDWFLDEDGKLISPQTVCPVRTSCDDRDQIEGQVEQTIQSYSNL